MLLYFFFHSNILCHSTVFTQVFQDKTIGTHRVPGGVALISVFWGGNVVWSNLLDATVLILPKSYRETETLNIQYRVVFVVGIEWRNQ